MWSSPGVRRILAYREPVDMRKAFDGLLGLVKGVLAEDPLSGSLFVFVNRRQTYLKALYWDRTGFCLFAKRLERGQFRFPQDEPKIILRFAESEKLRENSLLPVPSRSNFSFHGETPPFFVRS